MLRREFILGAGGTLASAAPARRPNLIFILADQWRAQTMPGLDANLHAPNLERLTSESVRFERVYASYPLCTPSRATLMTGRFPHACHMTANDLQLPLDQNCIADVLKRAGYATGYVGKWHLDGDQRPGFVPPGPRRRGFDDWAAFNRGHRYFDSIYFRDTEQPIRPAGFEPDYQTGLAIDFIQKNRERPFYLFLSWGPPHTPRTPPARTAKLYDPAQFALRDNVPADYRPKAREGYAGYYGLCSALDENLGRLLKAVDQAGIAGDTIVVFTADHGDMLGSHGLEYKNLPYEESARVPLLIRHPSFKPGSTSDLLISNVDYMPTLLRLCGVDPPDTVQGRDLSALLLTGAGDRPQSIFAEGQIGSPGEWRLLVRGLDKLVTNAKGDPLHLFNLGQDPFETEDLAREPGHALRIDELKALLRDWRKRAGDGMDASGLKRR